MAIINLYPAVLEVYPERMILRMINVEYSADIIVTSDEVAIPIRKLSTGKSSGLDGIYAEHLLHCSRRFVTMLGMCFTGLFVHGFLPDTMLEIVLVPTCYQG